MVAIDDVFAVCLPKTFIRAGVFRETVNTLFNILPHKTAKRLVNTVVGIMGRTEKRDIRVAFTNSELAESLRDSLMGTERHAHISPVADASNLFMVLMRETTNCPHTHLMIYMEVVSRAAVRLLQIARTAVSFGLKISGSATDSLVVPYSDLAVQFGEEYGKPDEVSPLESELFEICLKREVPSAPYRFSQKPAPLDMDGFMLYATDVRDLARGGQQSAILNSVDDLLADNHNEESIGCIVMGPAGSGKTYTITKLLKAAADEWGPTSALITTQTGLLCNSLSGKGLWSKTFEYMTTLYSKNAAIFYSKFGRLRVLAIDESARMNNRFLELLLKMRIRNSKLKIYIVGDPHQVRGFDVGPGGSLVTSPEYHKCSTVRKLVGFRSITLKAQEGFCRFEGVAFQAVAQFRENGTLMANAFTILDLPIEDWSEIEVNQALCLTCNMRDLINEAQRIRIFEDADDSDKAGNWCSGQKVVTHRQFKTELNQEPDDERVDVFNGTSGELLIVDGEEFIAFIQDDADGYEVRVTLDELDAYFRGGYAATIASFQGREIDGEFHLVEMDRMDKSEAYTGLSRCVRAKDVQIVPRMPNQSHLLLKKQWPIHRDWCDPTTHDPLFVGRTLPVQLIVKIYRPVLPINPSFVLAMTCDGDEIPSLDELTANLFEDNASMKGAIGMSKSDFATIRGLGSAAFVCAEVRSPYHVETKGAARETIRSIVSSIQPCLGQGLIGATVYDEVLGRSVAVFEPESQMGGEFPLVGNDPAVLSDEDEDEGKAQGRFSMASVITISSQKKFIRVRFKLWEAVGSGLEPRVFVRKVQKGQSVAKAQHAWERLCEGAMECEEADVGNLVVRMGGKRKWWRMVESRARIAFAAEWGDAQFDNTSILFDREEGDESDEEE